MQKLHGQQEIARALQTLVGQILSDPVVQATRHLALVGLRSGADHLAVRLAAALSQASSDLSLDVGALDITFYRDDLSSQGGVVIPQGTALNFAIDDRVVILVDDVLHTGRSVRAALDALVDFGRPRLIRLAVLVNRGGHEYPIAADYVGMRIDLAGKPDRVRVHLVPQAPEDGIFLAPAAGSLSAGGSR